MIIDITLATIFIASVAISWYRLSSKIPELIAVPDEVIAFHLEQNPARLRLFLLQVKSYYREKKYKDTFWRALGRTLYKIHIALMRLDNGTVNLLKRVKENSGSSNGFGSVSNGNGGADYWKQLKNESSPAVKEVNRVQEIRVKH